MTDNECDEAEFGSHLWQAEWHDNQCKKTCIACDEQELGPRCDNTWREEIPHGGPRPLAFKSLKQYTGGYVAYPPFKYNIIRRFIYVVKNCVKSLFREGPVCVPRWDRFGGFGYTYSEPMCYNHYMANSNGLIAVQVDDEPPRYVYVPSGVYYGGGESEPSIRELEPVYPVDLEDVEDE